MNNKSFRNWLRLTLSDDWIELWILGLIVSVVELFFLNKISDIISNVYLMEGLIGGIFTILIFVIPIIWVIVIGYFRLYKSWK